MNEGDKGEEQLAIVWREVTSLKPVAHNPRRHTEANVEKIAWSIQTYGWTTPVLLDEKDEVIAGHGRLLAAQKLGMKRVPTILLGNLTPQLVEAYRIADNRLALDSEWDETLLAEVMQNLKDQNFDLALTGFNEPELDQLLSPPTDIYAEWQGMPEFHSTSQADSFRAVIVHFRTASDVDAFQLLIGQQFSEKAKFIWHPAQPREAVPGHYAGAAENEQVN